MREAEDLERLVRAAVERVLAAHPDGDAPESRTGSAPAAAPGDRTVALGCDHGGFPLKQNLKEFLAAEGWTVDDQGTQSTEAVDYPVFAARVARRVATGACRFGIMVDGAGIGSAMVANKIAGVRAALCYDISTARNAREHNDANVLTLGAGLIGPALARDIARTFLAGRCTEERHLRRVAMIAELDHAEAKRP